VTTIQEDDKHSTVNNIMNSAMTTFRLLIVNDSPQESQRLSSMFHNAGKPCNTQHIYTEENLNKILADQDWDLVIAHDNCASISPAILVRSLRKYECDTAVILLTDEISSTSIVNGMKLGACDVAKLDDDQHLLLIVSRELENRRQRTLTRALQLRLKDTEQRNQKLLDSSRDGIAYIQDGMYLYANDSFAEMLGHKSRDDVEFMPIMDTIDETEHEAVKQALKNFMLHNNNDNNGFTFTALHPDNTKKAMTAELFVGEYDGESCIQIMCYAKLETQEIIEAELQNIKFSDATTGLYNRAYLIEEIEKSADGVALQQVPQSFIYIDIDRFSDKVKNVLSITDSDYVLKSIADFIKDHYHQETAIARLSDNSFGIISNENDADNLLDNSSALCKRIAEHIFEVGNKTVQITLSVGICIIDETTADHQSVINHAIQAADTLRKTHDGNGSNIYQKDAQENKIVASSLKKALENDDFKLLFQPILSLRGEDTERYEVLLRMIIDDKEISPVNFFKIAEGLKMGARIDRWVILESIRYLRDNHPKQIQQFINVSSNSLCDDTLLPWIKVAIDAAKIAPECIIFQAKEIDINQHLTSAKQFVSAAKKIGINFCITNFGSAPVDSPLATLNHIDASYIKIDGSLSQDFQKDPENTKRLKELVESLHAHEKVTIIPFIEQASILSKLWQLGVHCIQGNYLQPPSASMDYEFAPDG